MCKDEKEKKQQVKILRCYITLGNHISSLRMAKRTTSDDAHNEYDFWVSN